MPDYVNVWQKPLQDCKVICLQLMKTNGKKKKKKDVAVNVLHSICQQIWKTQQWPQDWNRQVFILNPEKDSAQTTECSHYCKTMFLSHASKVILKII